MQVNYIILPNSLTLSFDGKMFSIANNDHRYHDILKAIKEERFNEIPDLIDPSKTFDGIEEVELIDGRLYLNGKKIPEVLSQRVLNFKEKGLPFDSLIKFAEKLMKNPSFNSREMLYKFLEHNGIPLTKDGNFIAYKKVTSDFKDLRTNKMDNSVGQIVEMPREEVDDNPNNTCSSGLHVAAYKYASGFGNGEMVECEINPEDVVAVPNDYDGEKMRVCKYKVVAVCEKELVDVDLYEEEVKFYDPSDDDDDIDWDYFGL